jgi:hypothetical protein
MAVTTSIYNVAKYDFLTKAVSWTADDIHCALFSASTYGATDTAYDTEGTEVANANGYLTGGLDVSTKTATGTTTVLCKITGAAGGGAAGTTTWTTTGAGFSALAAKLYSIDNANRPIAHIDFGGTLTASGGGTFTITWDATNGVFKLS